jgi:NTE family protein
MIAIVMSGAGARGPLQVGALGALLEAGIRPNFIVGTSAGAINAVLVAARGLTEASLAEIQEQWKHVSASAVYPGSLWKMAWRVLRGEDSLYPNDGMRKLIHAGLPEGVETFGDLSLPLYVTAVDLISSRLFLFGEDGRVPLEAAVLASSAIPGLHPPVMYHGLQLVDGGVLANAAASVAMDKGATQVWTLTAGYGGETQGVAKGVVEVLNNTVTTMMAQSLLEDLARAQSDDTIDLHHLVLRPTQPVGFRDFGQVDSLVAAGYDMAKAYLAAPRPHVVAPRKTRRTDLGEIAPGVREFIPSYWQR